VNSSLKNKVNIRVTTLNELESFPTPIGKEMELARSLYN